MDMQALIGVTCLFTFLAVAFGIYSLKAPEHDALLEEDTSAEWWVPDAGKSRDGNLFDRYIRPGIHNFLPQAPMALLYGARKNKRILNLLVASGNPWRIRPEEFAGLLIISGMAGAGIGLAGAFAGVLPNDLPLIAWALIVGFVGFLLPWIMLQNIVTARLVSARRTLHEALDLMVTSMIAGRNFTSAATEVAGQLPDGIVQEEFTRMSRNIRSGATVREAVTELSKRIPGPEVESFAKAIINAEMLGSDVTQALIAQSKSARFNYEQMIDKKIARLNSTLIIPMTIFIVPALSIILAAPSLGGLGEGGPAVP